MTLTFPFFLFDFFLDAVNHPAAPKIHLSLEIFRISKLLSQHEGRMKENSGRGLRRRLARKALFSVALLAVLLAAGKFLVPGIANPSKAVQKSDGGEVPGLPPPRQGRPSASNFCDEFAIDAGGGGGRGSGPTLGIFHHAVVTSEKFNSGQAGATQTSLKGSVDPGMYEYFQVCIAEHSHHHKIKIELARLSPDGEGAANVGEVDLYISADERHPTSERGSTWLSRDIGNDSITIPTYADDFKASKSRTLYIGVHNRDGGGAWGAAKPVSVRFTLDVAVADVSVEEILKRGRLRGGQRILPGQAPKQIDVKKRIERIGGAS